MVKLDDTMSIEDGVTLPKGVIGVYGWKLFYRTSLLETGFVVHEASEPVLDVVRSRMASEQEIAEALGWEPPAPPKVVPAAPTFKRIPRKEGDSASYLGFRIQPGEMLPVKLSGGFTVVGFHLASPQVIGRIQTSLTFAPHSNAYLELAIYDAAGDRRLSLEITSPATQFNQVRLEAGDHAVIFRQERCD